MRTSASLTDPPDTARQRPLLSEVLLPGGGHYQPVNTC